MYESNFCFSTALSADDVFPAPTGPTYSRIVAFAKPAQSRTGRFPSTHSTVHCLSISESHFITRHTTPVRDVTVVSLPAGREHNYLTFGAPGLSPTPTRVFLAGFSSAFFHYRMEA